MEYQTQTVDRKTAAELIERYRRAGITIDVNHLDADNTLIVIHQSNIPKRHTPPTIRSGMKYR